MCSWRDKISRHGLGPMRNRASVDGFAGIAGSVTNVVARRIGQTLLVRSICPHAWPGNFSGCLSLSCELIWGQVAERGVESVVVVMAPPFFETIDDVSHRQEPRCVETFCAQTTVEGFTKCVVHWLSRSGEVDLHAAKMRPLIQHSAGKLRAIVATNSLGLAAFRNAHLYMCGPYVFMECVTDVASRRWPSASIHQEFFSPPQNLHNPTDEQFTVALAKRNIEIVVPFGQSIVDVLHDSGIPIDVSCRHGICGTCMTEILKGKADHRDAFLSADEHACGKYMLPCVSRATGTRIVLNL